MRGQKARIGDETVTANGYHYTRTKEGWVLTHRIVAAKKLGRKLKKTERVFFEDGDRKNLDPNNLIVSEKKQATPANRKARIEARIAELQAQLAEIEQS